MCNY